MDLQLGSVSGCADDRQGNRLARPAATEYVPLRWALQPSYGYQPTTTLSALARSYLGGPDQNMVCRFLVAEVVAQFPICSVFTKSNILRRSAKKNFETIHLISR